MIRRPTGGRNAGYGPQGAGPTPPPGVSWTPAHRRDPATLRVLAQATRLAREVVTGKTSPQRASAELPGPWYDLIGEPGHSSIVIPAGAGYRLRRGFVVAAPALVHRAAAGWVMSDWSSGMAAPWSSALRAMRIAAPWALHVMGVHPQARLKSSLYLMPEGVRLSRTISEEDLRAGEWAARLGLLAERECKAAWGRGGGAPPKRGKARTTAFAI
jgi:hypothetical protein